MRNKLSKKKKIKKSNGKIFSKKKRGGMFALPPAPPGNAWGDHLCEPYIKADPRRCDHPDFKANCAKTCSRYSLGGPPPARPALFIPAHVPPPPAAPAVPAALAVPAVPAVPAAPAGAAIPLHNVWGDTDCDRWVTEDPIRCRGQRYKENCAKRCSAQNIWGDADCDRWVTEDPTRCLGERYQENCRKRCLMGRVVAPPSHPPTSREVNDAIGRRPRDPGMGRRDPGDDPIPHVPGDAPNERGRDQESGLPTIPKLLYYNRYYGNDNACMDELKKIIDENPREFDLDQIFHPQGQHILDPDRRAREMAEETRKMKYQIVTFINYLINNNVLRLASTLDDGFISRMTAWLFVQRGYTDLGVGNEKNWMTKRRPGKADLVTTNIYEPIWFSNHGGDGNNQRLPNYYCNNGPVSSPAKYSTPEEGGTGCIRIARQLWSWDNVRSRTNVLLFLDDLLGRDTYCGKEYKTSPHKKAGEEQTFMINQELLIEIDRLVLIPIIRSIFKQHFPRNLNLDDCPYRYSGINRNGKLKEKGGSQPCRDSIVNLLAPTFPLDGPFEGYACTGTPRDKGNCGTYSGHVSMNEVLHQPFGLGGMSANFDCTKNLRNGANRLHAGCAVQTGSRNSTYMHDVVIALPLLIMLHYVEKLINIAVAKDIIRLNNDMWQLVTASKHCTKDRRRSGRCYRGVNILGTFSGLTAWTAGDGPTARDGACDGMGTVQPGFHTYWKPYTFPGENIIQLYRFAPEERNGIFRHQNDMTSCTLGDERFSICPRITCWQRTERDRVRRVECPATYTGGGEGDDEDKKSKNYLVYDNPENENPENLLEDENPENEKHEDENPENEKLENLPHGNYIEVSNWWQDQIAKVLLAGTEFDFTDEVILKPYSKEDIELNNKLNQVMKKINNANKNYLLTTLEHETPIEITGGRYTKKNKKKKYTKKYKYKKNKKKKYTKKYKYKKNKKKKYTKK